MPIKWRKLFRAVHRDMGYAAVGLTVAYALSGIAVNHIEDWNPSYSFDESSVAIGPVPGETLADRGTYVVNALHVPARDVRSFTMETATELRVFLAGGSEIRLDTATGRGTRSEVTERAVFFQVNALHLNNLKGAWTYIADIFALALMLLAISGMVMNKGARGLAGRGKWFVGAGLALPIAAIVYLYR